jgi:hypothetical protein
VFVHHVEERFTWVDSIAGIRLGGLAPLRWRGCGKGCLEFLNPTTITEEEEPEVVVWTTRRLYIRSDLTPKSWILTIRF